MKLLLSNDDGFDAPGMKFLHSALYKKHSLTVSAPAIEQSGVGHAFTYRKGINLVEREYADGTPGFAVAGTPADCVKVALGHLLGELPDAVVSGINNGDNTGIAGFYSGTVGAAREAAFWGVPAVAFSVANNSEQFYEEYVDLIEGFVLRLTDKSMTFGENGKTVFYNVNFPGCVRGECKGIRVCQQSLAFYRDTYRKKNSENGEAEYWLRGVKEDVENSDDFDARAIENKWITVTPHHFDTTDFGVMKRMSDINAVWKE